MTDPEEFLCKERLDYIIVLNQGDVACGYTTSTSDFSSERLYDTNQSRNGLHPTREPLIASPTD